jgi:hypothetical protein
VAHTPGGGDERLHARAAPVRDGQPGADPGGEVALALAHAGQHGLDDLGATIGDGELDELAEERVLGRADERQAHPLGASSSVSSNGWSRWTCRMPNVAAPEGAG